LNENWWIRGGGTGVIRLPPLSPNLNAFAERFVPSSKEDCLRRMVFCVGQTCSRRAIAQHVMPLYEERDHQ
jgi:putative transposase